MAGLELGYALGTSSWSENGSTNTSCRCLSTQGGASEVAGIANRPFSVIGITVRGWEYG